MGLSRYFGAANASSWLPVERLLFVVGWLAAATALISAVLLELSSDSRWVVSISSPEEFTRSLPSEADLNREAKQLPASAKRFSLQEPITTPLASTVIGYRKYVGFYNPTCQQELDHKRKLEDDKRRLCNDSVVKTLLFPASPGRQDNYADCPPSSNFFPRLVQFPADECVLWSEGDHYVAMASRTYWQLDNLFGSFVFLSSAILAGVSFLSFFLIRPVLLPLFKWIRGEDA